MAWEDEKEEFKLAAQDRLLGYSILKCLIVGEDSFCTRRVGSTAQASEQNFCLVSFGSSPRISAPMGCLVSPRMDTESEDEQEAAGHAPVAPGANPPTPPVRRKPTPYLPTFLFLGRVPDIVCAACLLLRVTCARCWCYFLFSLFLSAVTVSAFHVAGVPVCCGSSGGYRLHPRCNVLFSYCPLLSSYCKEELAVAPHDCRYSWRS